MFFFNMKIDYTNEAFVYGLPAEKRYNFFLTVYDSKLKQWSPFSQPSATLYEQISVKLQVKQAPAKHNNELIFSWKQQGKFTDHRLSRFKIHIYLAKTGQLFKTFHILDKITKCKSCLK